jgi:hypothetical protein
MAFVPLNPSLGYPPIAEFVDATGDDYVKPVPFGTIIVAADDTYGAGEFIFLKGVASTVDGSWVTYNTETFATTLIVPDAIGPVAIAMAATVADEAGWYMIQGNHTALSGDVADSGLVYIDTVAGTADDAVVAGDKIHNATWASADDTATGKARVRIARPFVTDEST